MALTLEQVQAILAPDEPVAAEIAKIDGDSLASLERLIEGPDRALAVKAAFCLRQLGNSGKTLPIISRILARPDTAMRVAVAAAVHTLPESQAQPLLKQLLIDHDPGVRKVVLRSMTAATAAILKPELEHMAAEDEHAELRSMASHHLRAATGNQPH